MKLLILTIGLIAITAWIPCHSQQVKTPVQLGDQYYAAGEYYTAAHLYGQFLNPSKKQKQPSAFPLNSRWKGAGAGDGNVSRNDVLYKQAESYRLANYWEEAATAYKEYADKNGSQQADALYWHAVCKRSLGEYDSAEVSLQEYLKVAGSNSQYQIAAQKELQTLKYIRQQLTRPDSILVKGVNKLNAPNSFERGVFAPVHVGDNKFLVSSTQPDSVQVEGINPNRSRLFYTTLNNGSLEEVAPAELSVVGPRNNQGAAAVSSDGNHLYVTEWRKENGRTVSFIYHSVKEGNDWSKPVLLPSVNVNGFNSKQPFVSPDGKYLYFASDRPGGSGKFDIWYAPLNNDGSTGEPVNAGKVINTAGDELAPFYHTTSSSLVFSSNGPQTMGGLDLFAAKGNPESWKAPENLGYPVNSSRDDIYFYAPENGPLLNNAVFSSDRGNGCCLETYTITKASKRQILTGVLRDCMDNQLVSGAELILKDISGKTWKSFSDEKGSYQFDLGNEYVKDFSLSVIINREEYKEKTMPLNIEKTDESDMLTDQLIGSELCITRKELIVKREDVVIVYFDFDKSDLKPVSNEKLDSIYTVLVENPTATIQVGAHTDGKGTDEYNKILADKRARACVDYLVNKGIDPARISFESFGKCCPAEQETTLDGQDNPDARALNRRALIHVKME